MTCEPETMALRVLIVDDNEPFLEAARVLLRREGVEVVGVASTSAETLYRAAQLQPDVVLVDVMLGPDSGVDLAWRLNEEGWLDGGAVILVSTHAEADLVDLIADSPAIGFLPKAELSADAIRRMVSAHPR
jgi:two-component system nitrate/nitrite response regulator NarL